VIYVQGSGAILLPFCHWPVLAKSASSQAIPSQQEEQRWKEASVLDFSDCRRKVLLEYTRGRFEQGETVKVWIWLMHRDERQTFAIESPDEMLVASLLQELCWMQMKTDLAIFPLSRYGGSLVTLESLLNSTLTRILHLDPPFRERKRLLSGKNGVRFTPGGALGSWFVRGLHNFSALCP
jgi:hypothetical protein